MDNFITGVTNDIRSIFHKQKDFKHEELSHSNVPMYGDKITISPFFYENQNQTSSCIAHGVTLAQDIEFVRVNKSYIRTSKMYVYRQRSNFNSPGMWLQEGLQLIKVQGSCLYETLPTPITEAEANNIVITSSQTTEALVFQGQEYYKLSIPNNIDTICSIASQGHGVPIVFYATYREWAKLYPDTNDNISRDAAPVRHCVCVLPNSGFMENGKKYVVIQDSAWFGGLKLRYLSEDFISARVYDAGYLNNVVLVAGQGTKPIYTFTNGIQYGDVSMDVLMLQKCLVYEGLLPENCTSGHFYGRTLAAVNAFQTKYKDDILTQLGLTAPTGKVGSQTIKKLNSLYSI